MKSVSFSALFLVFVLCVFVCMYSFFSWKEGKREEGFAEEEKEKEINPLISLVAQLKRMSTKLVDPAMWVDRLEMSTMTPVELARRHLQKV